MENIDEFTDDINEMLNQRTCIDDTLTEDEERWLEAIESGNIDDILYDELKMIKDPKLYGVRQKQQLPAPSLSQSQSQSQQNAEIVSDKPNKKNIVPPPVPELVPVSPSSVVSIASNAKTTLSVSSNKSASKTAPAVATTAVSVSEPQLPKLLPLSQKLLVKPLSTTTMTMTTPPSIFLPVKPQLSTSMVPRTTLAVINEREKAALLKRLEQKKLALERKENIRKKTVERLLKKASEVTATTTASTATASASTATLATSSAIPSVSMSSCSRNHRQSIANLISGSNLNLVSVPFASSTSEMTSSETVALVADCSTLSHTRPLSSSNESNVTVSSATAISNDFALTKNQTTKESELGTNATTRWIDTRNSTTLSFPKDFSFLSHKTQNNYVAPEIILCSMNCGNPKRYACSKTLKPLCSLECYKKNVNLNPKLFENICSTGHDHNRNRNDMAIE